MPSEYQPVHDGAWLILDVNRTSMATEYHGHDLWDVASQAQAVVEAAIDGTRWLAGTRVGCLQLEIQYMENDDVIEQGPIWESGPDRKYGMVAAVIYRSASRHGDGVSFGDLVLGVATLCFLALRWLRDRYALPDFAFASPLTDADPGSDSIPESPVNDREIALASVGPGEIGVIVPYHEDEYWTSSPRVNRIHAELLDALTPVVEPGREADVEKAQDATVWIFQLRSDLHE